MESIYPHCDCCPRNLNNFYPATTTSFRYSEELNFCLKLGIPLSLHNMMFYGSYNNNPTRCGRYVKLEKYGFRELIWAFISGFIGFVLERAIWIYHWLKGEGVWLERFKYDGKRTWVEKVEIEEVLD